jgi:lipocalin
MRISAKIINIMSVLAMMTSSVTANGSSCLDVETVQDFDLTKYVSKPWYVQQQAENTYSTKEYSRCVTAQYVEKGYNTLWKYNIGVYNYAEDINGSSIGGDLCASPVKGKSGKLQVAPCFLPKSFAGPYWVVAYNEKEGYALISGGRPKYEVEDSGCGDDGTSSCCKTGDGINNSGLWIFTRNQNPDKSLIKKVRAIATKKGFSTSVLFDVDHTDCDNVPNIVPGGSSGSRQLRGKL